MAPVPESAKSVSLPYETVEDLIYLARAGDLDELKTTLADLSTHYNASISTIIHGAIDIDESSLTNLTAPVGSGACLLHYPSANGNTEVVRYLLEQVRTEAVPLPTANNTHDLNGNDGKTKLLVNHPNTSSNTPLHWAALNGHLEIVKLLVAAGADPTIVNDAGRDVVVEAEYSSRDGSDECAQWLLANCAGLDRGVSVHDNGVSEANGVDEAEDGDEHKDGMTNGAD